VNALSALLVGFATGIGLIVAIGTQNAFVLRQGIRREHVAVVVAVCAISDLLLIGVGTAGIGIIFERAPWIIQVMRWGGVAYLRSAFGSASSLQLTAANGSAPPARSVWAVAGATAALTWLNPHVYLDTVVMLGTVANQQAQPWVFAVGAMLASLVWFAALGFGAHLLAPVLRSPRAWRAIDVGIALVMVLVAAKLAFAF
jgi:L-lysine exporter family protein LysE/ArgO